MESKITSRLVSALKPAEKVFEVCDTELPGFVLRVRPNGSMSYMCAYRREDGRKTHYVLGSASVLTAQQARDMAWTTLGEIRKGHDPVKAKRRMKTLTLRSYLDNEYGPWVLVNHKSGRSTLDRIVRRFSNLLDKPLNEITPWLIEKWRLSRKTSDVAAHTINRDVAALRAALSLAVVWDFIDHHPFASLKPMRAEKNERVRYLSDDEERRLRHALDEREKLIRSKRESANEWRAERGYERHPSLLIVPFVDYLKPLVLLSLNTGLRRGEALLLRWEYRRTVGDVTYLCIPGGDRKNSKQLDIPLSAEAASVLNRWFTMQGQPSAGLIFSNRDGTAMQEMKTAWRNVLKAAAINDFRWHDQRHHFASKLTMANVSLQTVKELLGHSSVRVTERYAHVSRECLVDAVSRLTPPIMELSYGQEKLSAQV